MWHALLVEHAVHALALHSDALAVRDADGEDLAFAAGVQVLAGRLQIIFLTAEGSDNRHIRQLAEHLRRLVAMQLDLGESAGRDRVLYLLERTVHKHPYPADKRRQCIHHLPHKIISDTSGTFLEEDKTESIDSCRNSCLGVLQPGGAAHLDPGSGRFLHGLPSEPGEHVTGLARSHQ